MCLSHHHLPALRQHNPTAYTVPSRSAVRRTARASFLFFLLTGKLARLLHRRIPDRIRIDYLVDKAQSFRFSRPDVFRGEEQRQGLRKPYEPRQALRASPAGKRPSCTSGSPITVLGESVAMRYPAARAIRDRPLEALLP